MADDNSTKSEEQGPHLGRELLKARTVLLFGPIEPKSTKQVIGQILALNQMDDEKPIRLYINSPGGVADDGFAIYDILQFVKAPVYTICSGLAASAATIVLVGGERGHRYSLKHSRLMMHQPSQGAQGTASDIAITAKEIIRLRHKANALFAADTGKAVEDIQKDMHRDFWMSAQDAQTYGLIDEVVTAEADLPS